MSELVPPPAYVEYPRDPRLRKLDEIDRLALMAKGHSYLVAPFFAVLLLSRGNGAHEFYWAGVGLSAFFNLLIAVIGREGLSLIFRAKGWSETKASCLALAIGGLGVLHSLSVLPFWITSAAYFGVGIATFCFVDHVVGKQFRLFGLKKPLYMAAGPIQKMVEDLRSSESESRLIGPDESGTPKAFYKRSEGLRSEAKLPW